MGTAIALRNVVGETENVFLIRLVPLQRNLHRNVVAFGAEVHDRRMQRRFVAVEMLNKGANTAFVLKHVFFVAAFVAQTDAHTGIQEREFA